MVQMNQKNYSKLLLIKVMLFLKKAILFSNYIFKSLKRVTASSLHRATNRMRWYLCKCLLIEHLT